MQIVDAQIHLWGSGLPSNQSHIQVTHFTPEEAIALMDEGGVDAAIIHPPGWDPNSTEMALKAVQDYFMAHPQTDVLLGDTVVVDKEGGFICVRKSLVPQRNIMWVFNPVITSSVFIHRRVLDQHHLFFDEKWRDLGDKVWTVEMVRRGLKMAVLRRFTSSFSDTGENMNLKPNAIREAKAVMEMAPSWVRRWKWPLWQLHRLRQVCHLIYWQRPFDYSIYTLANPERRVDFHVEKPTAVWWTRHRDNQAKVLPG